MNDIKLLQLELRLIALKVQNLIVHSDLSELSEEELEVLFGMYRDTMKYHL